VKLNVLGPEGTWTLVSARGAKVTPTAGKVGDVISVTPTGALTNYEILLEYRGGAVVSSRGATTLAGRPYRFGYSNFVPAVEWRVSFFEFAETADPVKAPAEFAAILKASPVKTYSVARLDFLSGGVLEEGVARDRFALVAEGTVTLPPGDYTLQVISDDGARVWADDKLVLDAWAPHESRLDRVPLRGGTRKLRVEYYEVGGWAEMRLDIQPRRTRK
jgi:hypothetical protein